MRRSAKPLGIAALGLLALAASAFLAVRRPLHFDSAWTDTTRAAFARATGLDIAIRGPIDVSVFPRPMIVAHDVTIGRGHGALAVEAPVVRGLFSVLGLLANRSVFDKLEFDDVSGTADADDLIHALGRDRSLGAVQAADPALHLPGTVAINGGSIQLRSLHPGVSGFLTDLHLLVDGVDGGSGAVAGGAVWHGVDVAVSGRVDSVGHLFAGKPTAGTLKLRSAAGSASAVGTVTIGHPGRFSGSVTASSPALATLFRMAGLPPGMMEGIGHFGFSGTAEPTPDGIAFEDAHLAVNEDNLEGSIALERRAERVDLVGTLAAEKLDIDPFVAVLPGAHDKDGGWNDQPIPFEAAGLHDTDLRLSVGRLQYAGLHADDVALSVLCRQGRMELSLGEARTYGGMLKARLFTAPAPGHIKAEVSWSQVDMASLSKALPQVLPRSSGTSSGTLSLDGAGDDARQIVHHLDGKGQASWRQLHVPSQRVLATLLQPAAEVLPIPLTFDLAALDFSIADGLLSVGKATLSDAGLRVDITGQTFLPDGTFLLAAAPAPADGAVDTVSPAAPIRRVAGVWGKSVSVVKGSATPPSLGPSGPTDSLSR